MVGIVGLYECVNHFLQPKTQEEKFGFNPKGDEIANKILSFLEVYMVK